MDSRKPLRKTPLGPALRALSASARRGLGADHPDADQLAAYHERRLGDQDVERLRDHLALCSECAGLLLELAAFSAQTPAEGATLSDREVEESWRGLASRLAAGDSPAEPPRRRPAVLLPWALAASFLLGVLALSIWVALLRRELDTLARPRADAVLADLVPNGEDTRGESGSRDEAPRADRPATLILHASAARSYPDYELRILGGQPVERVIWSAGGLHPRELGLFVLDLPAGALPPGRYRVRLYGVDAGKREPVADYDLAIGGG